MIVVGVETCVVCGWPAGYAVHREDLRDQSFPTAEGIAKKMVKGHAYVAPNQGDA